LAEKDELQALGDDPAVLAVRRIKSQVQRPNEELGPDDVIFEDEGQCDVCDQPGLLLLCDGMHGTCNYSCCLTCAKLAEVPQTDWFCDDCRQRGFDHVD